MDRRKRTQRMDGTGVGAKHRPRRHLPLHPTRRRFGEGGAVSFAAIGLVNPKTPVNVGSVLRAAFCYDAAMVAISGQRGVSASTDTPAAYRHIPTLRVSDLHDVIPFDCIPVAVDLIDGAR